MARYLIIFSILFTFGACQSETPQQEQQSEQQFGEQMQPQQPGADTDVSDGELEKFVEATINTQQIQMDSQEDMVSKVEEEGISVERFNEIAESQQRGQSEEDINATSEEMENFNSAMQAIQQANEEMQPEIENAIEDAGLKLDRYQEINIAIQQSPELQQKAQQKFQEKQAEQMQQGK